MQFAGKSHRHFQPSALPSSRARLSHPIRGAKGTHPVHAGPPARPQGSLFRRNGTGYAYWYRVYKSATGKQVETLIGKDENLEALVAARAQLEFAQWSAQQVRDLRKLDFQVADKGVARVLVELYNEQLLGAGLTVVGTLAFMAWLNELGAKTVTARTLDLDLGALRR